MSEPEPSALRADRLGLWWVLAAGLVVAVAFGATGHPLRATAEFAGTCVGVGGLRALLPKRVLGALVVRRGRRFVCDDPARRSHAGNSLVGDVEDPDGRST